MERMPVTPFLFQNEYPAPQSSKIPENIRLTGGKNRWSHCGSSGSKRRSVQKRVLSIPIGNSDESRPKGEVPPPPDPWAWRKYGQKPIKGSPYPRGYYRCSSSKGCPARKQVEQSRSDPATLIITYNGEHTHPRPPAAARSSKASIARSLPKARPSEPDLKSPTVVEPEDAFVDAVEGGAPILSDEFVWFSDLLATSPAADSVLRIPICMAVDGEAEDDDMGGMALAMGEEDDSLFADLGELPGCPLVLRRRFCRVEGEDAGHCGVTPAA